MFKYSWKNTVRTPVKTILFIILITICTAFLSLGIGMLKSSRDLIKKADKTFTTVAMVEYTGGQYPDETNFDKKTIDTLRAFDSLVLTESDCVTDFTDMTCVRGYIKDLKLNSRFPIPYVDTAIIEFRIMYVSEDMIRCMVTNPYYTNAAGEGYMFCFNMRNKSILSKMIIEPGQIYLAHGEFYIETNHLLAFKLISFVDRVGTAFISGETMFPEDNIFNITDRPDYMESENGNVWKKLIDYYRVQNSSLPIVASNDIELLRDFYMSEKIITEGTYFTEEDYEKGNKVCLISEDTAYVAGLKLGSELEMALHYSDDPIYFYSSYWWGKELKQEKYKVIGIYKSSEGTLQPNVYIPEASTDSLPDKPLQYFIGTAKLKNGTGDKYLSDMKDKLPGGMRISVYDQGYMLAIQPLLAINRTALILTIICACCCVAVLTLFVYLFIAKQTDTTNIMITLGTGKRKTMVYLLYCALLIVAVSAICGCIVGYFVTDEVFDLAYSKANEIYVADIRYSSMSLGRVKEFNSKSESSVVAPVISLLSVLVFTTTLCVYYAIGLIKASGNFGGQQKKKKTTVYATLKESDVPEKEYRQSTSGIGKRNSFRRFIFVFSTALLSIKRSMRKNIVIPLVSCLIAGFIMVFSGILAGYKDEYRKIYDIPVKSYYTSTSGRDMPANLVPTKVLKYVDSSEYIDTVTCSSILHYEFYGKGTQQTFTGEPQCFVGPIRTAFSMETRLVEIFRSNNIVFTQNMLDTPEFFFSAPPQIEFMEGYDMSYLADTKREYSCIITRTLAEQYGIHIGDMIILSVLEMTGNSFNLTLTDFKVVGTYTAANGRDNIYCQYKLAENFNYSQIDYKCYTMKNTQHLSDFKDELEALGVTSVGHLGTARCSMVIDDKTLLQTEQNLQNHISFMEVLYIFIFAAVLLIGFVVSYLTSKTRRPEFAIYRSMGTGKARTFFMFFTEQLILCILGSLVGIFGALAIFAGIADADVIKLLLFVACYTVGSIIAISLMNKDNVMEILTNNE